MSAALVGEQDKSIPTALKPLNIPVISRSSACPHNKAAAKHYLPPSSLQLYISCTSEKRTGSHVAWHVRSVG